MKSQQLELGQTVSESQNRVTDAGAQLTFSFYTIFELRK